MLMIGLAAMAAFASLAAGSSLALNNVRQAIEAPVMYTFATSVLVIDVYPTLSTSTVLATSYVTVHHCPPSAIHCPEGGVTTQTSVVVDTISLCPTTYVSYSVSTMNATTNTPPPAASMTSAQPIETTIVYHPPGPEVSAPPAYPSPTTTIPVLVTTALASSLPSSSRTEVTPNYTLTSSMSPGTITVFASGVPVSPENTATSHSSVTTSTLVMLSYSTPPGHSVPASGSLGSAFSSLTNSKSLSVTFSAFYTPLSSSFPVYPTPLTISPGVSRVNSSAEISQTLPIASFPTLVSGSATSIETSSSSGPTFVQSSGGVSGPSGGPVSLSRTTLTANAPPHSVSFKTLSNGPSPSINVYSGFSLISPSSMESSQTSPAANSMPLVPSPLIVSSHAQSSLFTTKPIPYYTFGNVSTATTVVTGSSPSPASYTVVIGSSTTIFTLPTVYPGVLSTQASQQSHPGPENSVSVPATASTIVPQTFSGSTTVIATWSLSSLVPHPSQTVTEALMSSTLSSAIMTPNVAGSPITLLSRSTTETGYGLTATSQSNKTSPADYTSGSTAVATGVTSGSLGQRPSMGGAPSSVAQTPLGSYGSSSASNAGSTGSSQPYYATQPGLSGVTSSGLGILSQSLVSLAPLPSQPTYISNAQVTVLSTARQDSTLQASPLASTLSAPVSAVPTYTAVVGTSTTLFTLPPQSPSIGTQETLPQATQSYSVVVIGSSFTITTMVPVIPSSPVSSVYSLLTSDSGSSSFNTAASVSSGSAAHPEASFSPNATPGGASGYTVAVVGPSYTTTAFIPYGPWATPSHSSITVIYGGPSTTITSLAPMPLQASGGSALSVGSGSVPVVYSGQGTIVTTVVPTASLATLTLTAPFPSSYTVPSIPVGVSPPPAGYGASILIPGSTTIYIPPSPGSPQAIGSSSGSVTYTGAGGTPVGSTPVFTPTAYHGTATTTAIGTIQCMIFALTMAVLQRLS